MTINVVKSTSMPQIPLYSIMKLMIEFLYNLILSSYTKALFIICIVVFIIPINRAIAEMPTIILASDNRCPYSCNPQDPNPGYLVEMAQKIFEIYGIKVEYKLMPWADALKAVEEGKIDGVIGINDIGGRDLITSTTPQALTVNSVFTRVGTDWVYDEPESLAGKKIAMVLDYDIHNASIQQYITTNYLRDPWSFVVESGIDAVADSINSIVDKTSDVYIGCQEVVNYYLDSNNLNSKIKNCGKIEENSVPIYIAFSASSAKAAEYIKMLEDGMISIDTIGDLTSLKNKYQIAQ
ncbi:Putative ABC transporter substrate-binding protein [Candidatus Trichorickettsia mobilis]|uniref:ABC transporter substrate-binding protein n=1 Tax=Candidatus Trichorickettsia mobilis TaxID=1346319 RepID=A0ABZ0UWL6_9RICK|nr:transporter substrate-binding domain-containing protein [Candidatus Trichorickettsia mobilis]WPY01418.1 Putative ABC transporter substrate-binding protein [Candidatus Trichorickettsia mobilis]